MYPTKNDLSAVTRKTIIDLLSPLLADAIDLKTQTKQAHWNVKGESFIAVHELFDKVASEVDESADLIAERIVQLGGEAAGTARTVAKQSRLKDYPYLAADIAQHADALSSAMAAFTASTRQGVAAADDAGDMITADILTGITRALDKLLWFVEAHIENAQAQKRKTA